MAWTAPADWAVSEVVTAAKMNTHVRDNLKFLKGTSGQVDFDSDVLITNAQTTLLTLENSGGAVRTFLGITTAAGSVWDINRNPTGGAFDDTAKSHARIALDGNAAASFISFLTAAAANTTGTERVRITGSGLVGINRTTPQGLLHGYSTIGGFLYYEFDGVDGTARTVIPDGAGDVVYGLVGLCAVRHSGGATKGGIFTGTASTLVAPGNTADLYNVGGTDILQIQVAANGSVTVQRTAGGFTYKVCLWLLWL